MWGVSFLPLTWYYHFPKIDVYPMNFSIRILFPSDIHFSMGVPVSFYWIIPISYQGAKMSTSDNDLVWFQILKLSSCSTSLKSRSYTCHGRKLKVSRGKPYWRLGISNFTPQSEHFKSWLILSVLIDLPNIAHWQLKSLKLWWSWSLFLLW